MSSTEPATQSHGRRIELSGSTFKQWASGGDSITCRGLKEDTISFRANALHCIAANSLPPIAEESGDAVNDRIRVIAFEQQFKIKSDDNYDATVHKERDASFPDRVNNDHLLLAAYFWRCMDGFDRFVERGFVYEPDSVKESTLEVQEDEITWKDIVARHFEKTDNKADFVSGFDVKRVLTRAGVAIPSGRTFGFHMVTFVSGIVRPTKEQKAVWTGKNKADQRGYYGIKKVDLSFDDDTDF